MPNAGKSVCVYCGSRLGARPAYASAATLTGRMLASNGWRLVWGAGDVGIMGAVAAAAAEAGGDTMGVIPTHLIPREAHRALPARHVVTETMHERKKVMFMNADAVVVLPGGAGSLDELFEVVTWRQIGLHAKPVFLLDTEGYWQPFLALLDHVVTEGFAEESLKSFVTPVPDVPALEAALRQAFAPAAG